MILLVTIITSSAVLASSFITRYTICRKLASLFWNSFDIPKKSDVASLVGNFSPVKRSKDIFVKRIRHFRGDIGDVLKTRASTGKHNVLCMRRVRMYLLGTLRFGPP